MFLLGITIVGTLIEYVMSYCNIPPLLKMVTWLTRKLSAQFLHPCILKQEHFFSLSYAQQLKRF